MLGRVLNPVPLGHSDQASATFNNSRRDLANVNAWKIVFDPYIII